MSQIKVELQDWLGNDRAIAESAWTSSMTHDAKELRSDTDVERVVNNLADSGHGTPFESVVCRFWLRIPIAIDRQVMTYRCASQNGMSGRYRTMPDEFLEMPDDVVQILRKVDRGYWIREGYDMHCVAANAWYQESMELMKEAKAAGVVPNDEYKRVREILRGPLPQHNMTERAIIMNLRALANLFKQRLKPDAQAEIREVARQMLDQLNAANVCPVALTALARNGWVI